MNKPFSASHKNSCVNVTALLLGAALAMTACTKITRVTTSAAGHQITAEIEGTPSVDNQPTQSVISGQWGKVTIERSRVLLEGGEWTNIPQDIPIFVRIAGHKLSVTARSTTVDGTSVIAIEQKTR